MGTKRLFDEDLEEFFVRRPKLLDHGDKPASFAETLPPYDNCQRLDVFGESERVFDKIHHGEGMENDGLNFPSDLSERSAIGGDDSSPDHFGFNIPRQTLQLGDLYTYLLNCQPRKDVPVGPDYQAEVPSWDPKASDKNIVGAKPLVYAGDELKFLGTCVIPFPDNRISSHECVSEDDRIDCGCPDGGSVRCVQQHIAEAREKLRQEIGKEKFVDLGFSDMGEVVQRLWNVEEEWTFNEVVYSNPVSLGKNFWEHLPLMLLSRTKKEFVSYYFNVFMLQKRAVQNRSNSLEIDSDDDEWQGGYDELVGIRGDADFAVPSSSDQDWSSDHDSNYISKVDSQRDGDGEVCRDNDGGGKDHILEPLMEKSPSNHDIDGIVNHVDNTPGRIYEDLNAKELHATYSDAITTNFCSSAGEKVHTENIRAKSHHGECLHNCNHEPSHE